MFQISVFNLVGERTQPLTLVLRMLVGERRSSFRKTGHDDISAHLCKRFEDGFCRIWSQITNFGVNHLASSESGVRSRCNSG